MRLNFIICAILFGGMAVLLNSCSQNSSEAATTKPKLSLPAALANQKACKYARRFSIAEHPDFRVVYLFGKVDIRDTSAIFIILKDSTLPLQSEKNIFVLRKPCNKIASLSSVYTSMLVRLGLLNNIAAIDNIDYYTDTLVVNKHASKLLPELLINPEIDLEKTVLLKPDIIFSFGMGLPGKAPDRRLQLAKIPMAVAVDHLEETPLARAEWIKFFAAFVDKIPLADSIFRNVERNYLALRALAKGAEKKPTVFTEIKYGEIWYVPGGKSFVARFLEDANAAYVWQDDQNTGSLNLGFEEVYVKAKAADFWLNLAMIQSKKELLAMESRYAEFKAFQAGNLYNNIKYINRKGYSNYWETGIMFPDKVLHDLILIFHPEFGGQLGQEMHYYKKIN